MKIKPKEILVDLPAIFMFKDYHEIPAFASTINQVIHGKVKVKCEELGMLGSEYVGLFYLTRNDEFHELREDFVKAIEEEERAKYGAP